MCQLQQPKRSTRLLRSAPPLHRIVSLFVLLALAWTPLQHTSAEETSQFTDPQNNPPSSLNTVFEQIVEMARLFQQIEPDEEARKTLRQAVARLFDLRMKLQGERLEALEHRLESLKTLHRQQEHQRSALIDARVTEILANPGLSIDLRPANSDPSDPSIAPNLPPVVAPGDVLAVYIPGVLPYQTPKDPAVPPPVNRIGNQLVTGYPISVSMEGTLPLPLIGEVQIGGLRLEDAKRLITRTYIDKEILRSDRATVIITMIRSENAQQWDPIAELPGLP